MLYAELSGIEGVNMPPITNDWQQPLAEEFKKPYYKDLYKKVLEEYRTQTDFSDSGRYFQCLSSDTVKRCKSRDSGTGSISQ